MRSHVRALLGYVALTLAFTWPLPLHMTTHLTGSPEGDTGVYVWNQWVFQHELLTKHSNPYFTDRIFALTGPANVTLNNYTTFANLLALPLVRLIGIVASFNVVYLVMTVLTAYAMFLLAREMTRGGEYEAWIAGAVFAWSPMLVTRGAGHFSLVAAAPLPLFVLLLERAGRYRRLRDAAALGLIFALALWSDVYYSVYCLILAAAYLASQVLVVEPRTTTNDRWRQRTLDVLILCAGAVVMTILVTGGGVITLFGWRIGIRELYTPVLALTMLVILRFLKRFRLSVLPIARTEFFGTVRLALFAAMVAALPLLPFLYAVGVRIAGGQWVSPAIYWRSSPSGVDFLAFALPNPNHPFAPDRWRAWLSSRPDGYLESVASVPLTAVAVLCLAWRSGWRAPRLWAVLWLTFAWMALGPFVHIAGINTYVPGPWTFLRYVPVLDLARNPARFAVLMTMALAVLLAIALRYLRDTQLAGRRWLGWVFGGVLLLELLPVPRALHSARIPPVYDRIAADPRDVVVLELPFGVRDGTFSLGNFTARTQFYQTRHGKAIVGGDLSRVSRRRVEAILRYPVLNALIQLSEGKTLDPATMEHVAAQAPEFLAHANVGYVVIDRDRASPALVDFAERAFRLESLEVDGATVLCRPVSLEASR